MVWKTLTSKWKQPKKKLSVVVVIYNIARQAHRSLFSLSAVYQRYIAAEDYEVIAVDNGSNPPLDPKLVENLAGNFRLIRIDDASPSPASAVNVGLAAAAGDVIGVMIDGARIATPGLLHFAAHGAHLYKRAVVASLGWYLGYDYQRWSMLAGYDKAREDALLDSIGWPQDGYRLFEIGTMDEPSEDGWLAPLSESNGLFLRREAWDLLGGMDKRFDLPGGGLVNLDTFCRAMELTDAELVIPLGEATFHQLHSGVATNVPPSKFAAVLEPWLQQYEAIRGRPWVGVRTDVPRTYLGVLPRPALARFVRTAVHPLPRHPEPPLGQNFDHELWSSAPSVHPIDPTVAGLVDLAHAELRAGRGSTAAAIARLTRQHAPEELEPQRMLSLIAGWRRFEETIGPLAEHHFAIAEAYRLLGNNEQAALHYRTALTHNHDTPLAHVGLASLRMPGESYYVWLDRLYASLAPKVVIEIGIFEGHSLARVRPPAIAIGIDPKPIVRVPLMAETHIFAETSDDFFARCGPDPILAGRTLDIGFIDGLHLYEQALKDFINLERYCGARSTILFHDTVPLDEATQSRARATQFHTGDVWKTVLALKYYRSDLDIFTIAAPWTGLTVVTGLDPGSRILADGYDEAVREFINTPFSEIENRLEGALNIVPNDWAIVRTRLEARGIPASQIASHE
jgi:Glycosyl transferase family 2